MKFFRLIFLGLILFIYPGNAFADTLINDDFSTNNSSWEYLYDSYRDVTNQYLVLTPNDTKQRGIVWLNRNAVLPLKVSFRYKAGPETNPGDGFTFMFCKDKEYVAKDGAALAFDSGQGYGIEFDSHKNENDISANHIALIQNTTTNHLKSVNDSRVADDKWHKVDIEIVTTKVTVKIDNNEVLVYEGNFNTTYKNVGFSAATGANTNLHLIDDVLIVSGEDIHKSIINTNLNDGAILNRTGTLSLNITASDEDGIQSLETYLDGKQILNNANINLANLALGQHLLKTVCTDKNGYATEKTITFYVKDNIQTTDESQDLLAMLAKGYQDGLINNKGIYNSLKRKLEKGNINAFIYQLLAQKGKHVSSRFTKELIIKACQYSSTQLSSHYEREKTIYQEREKTIYQKENDMFSPKKEFKDKIKKNKNKNKNK